MVGPLTMLDMRLKIITVALNCSIADLAAKTTALIVPVAVVIRAASHDLTISILLSAHRLHHRHQVGRMMVEIGVGHLVTIVASHEMHLSETQHHEIVEVLPSDSLVDRQRTCLEGSLQARHQIGRDVGHVEKEMTVEGEVVEQEDHKTLEADRAAKMREAAVVGHHETTAAQKAGSDGTKMDLVLGLASQETRSVEEARDRYIRKTASQKVI